MERIVIQRHFPKASIPKLKRVAAYARVSCGKDTMLHSLSAQVSYYSDMIQNHSGWQYVGVYADEALTGTRANRENFQRLLVDFRTIWQCNAKFKGEEKCRTPHLYEDDLKEHFVTALSKLLTDRDALLDDLRTIRAKWLDFHAIEKECEDLLQEMDVVSGMIKAVVNENASMEMSQAAYTDRYNALVDRFEKSQSRYDELQQLKERRQIRLMRSADACLRYMNSISWNWNLMMRSGTQSSARLWFTMMVSWYFTSKPGMKSLFKCEVASGKNGPVSNAKLLSGPFFFS